MPRRASADFSAFQRAVIKNIREVPTLAGAIAIEHIKNNFRRQGYGGMAGAWAPRKRRTKRNKGRNLLVDTGRLRRSFKKRGDKIALTTRVWTDKPYAKIHNEGGQVTGTATVRTHKRTTKGGQVTVKSHTRKVNFTMPKRQFMPKPGELMPTAMRQDIDKMIEQQIKKAEAALR